MEKAKAKESSEIVNSARNLQLTTNTTGKSKPYQSAISSALQSQFFNSNLAKAPPSLLSLCLGVVGRNLEDIIDDLADIALAFPPDIKLVLVAIARRRKLLDDSLIIALADSSWEILDLSGSVISDSGLCHVADVCGNLKAVDISRCSHLTSAGVSKFLQQCHSLQTLRWGGCPRSEHTARRCLSLLKPNLNNVEGESWEELDTTELAHGAQSLRWLVWPKIDEDSQEILTIECPRIVVNPKPSPLGIIETGVPKEALMQFVVDDPIVQNINPKTWEVIGFSTTTSRAPLLPVAAPNELSVAEKFRLAFLERDTRLAPKRAKNARQHQRRAAKEWMMTDSRAKASALASKATKSLNLRDL